MFPSKRRCYWFKVRYFPFLSLSDPRLQRTFWIEQYNKCSEVNLVPGRALHLCSGASMAPCANLYKPLLNLCLFNLWSHLFAGTMTRDPGLSLWSVLSPATELDPSHSACPVRAHWDEMTKKSWEGPWYPGVCRGTGSLGSRRDKSGRN